MNNNLAIQVNNLGKEYLVGEKERYLALRDIIANPLRIFKKNKKDTFWALKDIHFDVEKGDVVGIIGRNGSGKSTLLKVISRITEPTKGEIQYTGRVSSLLEVGTGFHPELTGKENIYLNGSILGMSRKEIDSKLKDIIEFSGVGEFIDMPVKRYSSGMQVRLAFSVAAHLEPDILIVDEVLAVGDAEFQSKCLGKMSEVTQSSLRTILFVSHDMGAIRRICNKCILLDKGNMIAYGPTEEIIEKYLQNAAFRTSRANLDDISNRPGNKIWTVQDASLLDDKGKLTDTFNIGEDINIEFEIKNNKANVKPTIGITLMREDGVRVANMVDRDSNYKCDLESKSISVKVSDNKLYPGKYFLSIWIGSSDGRDVYDHCMNVLCFEIINSGKYTSRQLHLGDGIILLNPTWNDKTN